MVLPLDRGELFHPPPFDLAAGGVQSIFGLDCVGVEFLIGKEGQLAGLLNRAAPLQRPVLAKHLECRAERC